MRSNYADVSMAEVAEQAEVTKGALYHYFDSKEELYLTMMHEDLAEKRAIFHQAATSGGTSRARLEVLTSAYFGLPRYEQELITLVRRDAGALGGAGRESLIRAYQSALPEQVELILKDGIRDGELADADPRLLSWDFVALVEVSLSPYATRAFATPQDKLEHVLSMFLSGAVAPSTISSS